MFLRRLYVLQMPLTRRGCKSKKISKLASNIECDTEWPTIEIWHGSYLQDVNALEIVSKKSKVG